MTVNSMKTVMKIRNLPSAVSIFILLVLLLASFIPILMMLSMSLRESLFIYIRFWALPWPVYWMNYSQSVVSMIMPIVRTVYLAAMSIAGVLVFSCLSAYAFARLRFFGKNAAFMVIVILLTIPGVLQLTANFVLADWLHLKNSLEGLALFYIGGGQIFAVFLLRGFFQSQPEEIFEAARIDGASELRCVATIAAPLAVPILITIALLNFMSIYNDLIFPSLMLNDQSLQTIAIYLQSYSPMPKTELADISRPQIGVMAAGYTIASIPMLAMFSFGMKYFIQGLTSGAIKS